MVNVFCSLIFPQMYRFWKFKYENNLSYRLSICLVNQYTGFWLNMEPIKYLFNEKDNIYEILQITSMEQNATDAQFFVENILLGWGEIHPNFLIYMDQNIQHNKLKWNFSEYPYMYTNFLLGLNFKIFLEIFLLQSDLITILILVFAIEV